MSQGHCLALKDFLCHLLRYDRKLWIGDFLKSVVYLPFEQSNGKPTLARRREGDTDAEDTSARGRSRRTLARSRRDRSNRSKEDARPSTGGRGTGLPPSGQR